VGVDGFRFLLVMDGYAITTSEVVSIILNSLSWLDISLDDDNNGSLKFGRMQFCFR
jgi:hypothetical protein